MTETYGPRLMRLAITLLRGIAVPPYNYMQHRAITHETLITNAESLFKLAPNNSLGHVSAES